MLFALAGSSMAQVAGGKVIFSDGNFSPAGYDVVTMTYVGSYNPNLRLYEATALGSVETCFENTQFSRPRGVDQNITLWDWTETSSTYEITWTIKKENRDTCKVLIGDSDSTVDGSDFLIWQRNYGGTVFRSSEIKSDDPAERTGDGSVRFISYSIDAKVWH